MQPSEYWSESEMEQLSETETAQKTVQKSEPVQGSAAAMEQKTDPETDLTTEFLSEPETVQRTAQKSAVV